MPRFQVGAQVRTTVPRFGEGVRGNIWIDFETQPDEGTIAEAEQIGQQLLSEALNWPFTVTHIHQDIDDD